MAKKFKRPAKAHGHNGRDDSPGTVRINLQRTDNKGMHVKGSLGRGISVANARVSEVAAAIEEALFGK